MANYKLDDVELTLRIEMELYSLVAQIYAKDITKHINDNRKDEISVHVTSQVIGRK